MFVPSPRSFREKPMFIMHIALGGCIKAPPITYGITSDTGGHITYLMGAAMAQVENPAIDRVEVITRLFRDHTLGEVYAQPRERFAPKGEIVRLETKRDSYLSKEELIAEIPAITEAFLDYLRTLDRLPDVIHAHFADAFVLANAARKAFGIRTVYTPHSLARDKGIVMGKNRDEGRIEREYKACTMADAIILSSRDEAERQVAGYSPDAVGRSHIIPPGATLIDTSASSDRAKELLKPFLRNPDKPIVLAIARPVAKKNLAALAEAFGTDPFLRENANLVIVAGQRGSLKSGDEEQNGVIGELVAKMDEYDLWGRMALPKTHTNEDVAALYKLANETGGVFVNPALFEPFGLTLVEAASAGVPVVATNKGGPTAIVNDIGHGALVDPTSAADIAQAIARLLLDKAAWQKASENGVKNAKRYSWDQYSDMAFSVYQDLLRPVVVVSDVAVGDHFAVCDIDNTLTGDSEAAIAFAKWAEANPQSYIVATGRSLPDARRELRRWHLPEPGYFITSVGTEIFRREGSAFKALDWYAEELEVGWKREEILAVLDDVGLTWQPVVDQKRFKLSLFGSATDASFIEYVLKASGLSAKIVHSHDIFIDVLPIQSGKSGAIAALARHLKADMDLFIAAGDSGNDRDMLEVCGGAIVVSNASRELANLKPRGQLYRSMRPHAAGVLEGFAHFERLRAMRRQ